MSQSRWLATGAAEHLGLARCGTLIQAGQLSAAGWRGPERRLDGRQRRREGGGWLVGSLVKGRSPSVSAQQSGGCARDRSKSTRSAVSSTWRICWYAWPALSTMQQCNLLFRIAFFRPSYTPWGKGHPGIAFRVLSAALPLLTPQQP